MNQTVHKYFQDGPNYSNTNNFCWNIKDMHMQAVVYSQTKMIWFVGDMICYHLQSNDMICRWPNLWQPGFVSRVVHLSYYHRQNFLKKGFMKKKKLLDKVSQTCSVLPNHKLAAANQIQEVPRCARFFAGHLCWLLPIFGKQIPIYVKKETCLFAYEGKELRNVMVSCPYQQSIVILLKVQKQ